MKALIRIKAAYTKWIHKRRFKAAKRHANDLHEMTKKRYYVIPVPDNQFRVINNDFVLEYNRKAAKDKRMDINDLLRIAVYTTGVKTIQINRNLTKKAK